MWSDDEAELLLNVTYEYEVKHSANSIDWEKVKSKYADILQLYLEQLPTPEEATTLEKDFPHKPEKMTQKRLTDKLKAIRNKYSQAVDAKKKSGFGRVVMLFFELCEKVWGGSPATIQIPCGVESLDLDSTVDTSAEVEEGDNTTTSNVAEESNVRGETESLVCAQQESEAGPSIVQRRRSLLNDQLTNYRQQKLKRKIPADAQLVECAYEDLSVKKKMLSQLDTMGKQYSENMAKLTNNVEQLTSSISQGFALLKDLLQPQQQYPPHHNVMFPTASQSYYNQPYQQPLYNFPQGRNDNYNAEDGSK